MKTHTFPRQSPTFLEKIFIFALFIGIMFIFGHTKAYYSAYKQVSLDNSIQRCIAEKTTYYANNGLVQPRAMAEAVCDIEINIAH